ncbi:MAG TPA: glycoside hydrolase family 31 protein [Lentimicrobium sp.]|nr:glycoside hydrolase family 31 protein [Lentimicrobium sp.]
MNKRFSITIKSAIGCLLFFIIINRIFGQAEDIGRLVSYNKTATGIEGIAETGSISIKVYNQNIIRVTASALCKVRDFSYSLSEDAIPVDEAFSLTETDKIIKIETQALIAEIEKLPLFRVTFKNKKGTVINEDMPGAGFSTGYSGNRTTIYKKLQPGERFVGLGEVLGNLDKRGMGYTLNNTDTYKYGDPRLPMYVSIPFFIGIHNHEVYGIFSHNTYKSFFNFGLSTPDFSSITTEGGGIDYFFIYDTTVAKVIEHYTFLTGRMPLPPLWSLGYHQSRCSYFPDDNVRMIAETLRRKKLPADCIVLDADYLQDYEPFRINKDRFPDMPALTANLADLGFEVTASVNPGIKLDSTYFAHKDGLEKDVFIKFPDGRPYTAEIAPSMNNYVDFTKPSGREWWIINMKFLPENGIYGTWNDMNEPAVGGSYLPDNLIFDFDGDSANALEAKNLYGMLMARSSYEAALKHGVGRRPFVLSRSGFAGIQRYAAVWTGDNTARDEFLLNGVLLNTQMGLSGVAFVGDDIGGYIGTTNKELFIRWMQTGLFSPYARNHKEAFSNANEPWSYGEEAEAISRSFLEFRYQLLPYLYSEFYETAKTGIPVARSLCIDYPFNDKIYLSPYQYQFLCGEALIVIPVTPQEKIKSIFLPQGNWYNFYNDTEIQGEAEFQEEVPIYKIPLFVKESSIITLQSIIQTTKEKPSDTLFVHIYNGNIKNTFTYYEDDGYSLGYKTGEYFKREILFDPITHVIQFSKAEGNIPSKFTILKVVLHGFDKALRKLVTDNSKTILLQDESNTMLDGLKYLKEIYDPTWYNTLKSKETAGKQKVFVIENSSAELNIRW